MIALLAAFQFLTISPAIVRRAFTPQELGRSVGFYPLVGLALGGVLVGLKSGLLLITPEAVSNIVILILWIVLTRALHFDGFLDACDGLFGGFTPEKRLEIMRDSRVGAFGVAGGVLLLLAKYAALPGALDALILAPVLGRWAMALAVTLMPYARQEGLGRSIKDHAGWPQLLIASLTAAAVAWLVADWLGLIALVAGGLVTWGWLRFVLTRIPGLTGDIYGATCEIVEVLTLFIMVIQIA